MKVSYLKACRLITLFKTLTAVKYFCDKEDYSVHMFCYITYNTSKHNVYQCYESLSCFKLYNPPPEIILQTVRKSVFYFKS